MTSRVGRWVRAVVCWGGSYENEATPPASVNGAAGTASSIAAGANHACAILTCTSLQRARAPARQGRAGVSASWA